MVFLELSARHFIEILYYLIDFGPKSGTILKSPIDEFEAPEYSQEGVDEFKRTIDRQSENMTFKMFGAYEQGQLLGVVATRNEGSHISLFFVRKENHGQGIGRKLFLHILPLCSGSLITVNSSPYAAKIYRRLGFQDTGEEQVKNGIRYVPMKYEK
jgi:GNAT superfamily N-acetyltransferase